MIVTEDWLIAGAAYEWGITDSTAMIRDNKNLINLTFNANLIY
jgi:hypothetical protein